MTDLKEKMRRDYKTKIKWVFKATSAVKPVRLKGNILIIKKARFFKNRAH